MSLGCVLVRLPHKARCNGVNNRTMLARETRRLLAAAQRSSTKHAAAQRSNTHEQARRRLRPCCWTRVMQQRRHLVAPAPPSEIKLRGKKRKKQRAEIRAAERVPQKRAPTRAHNSAWRWPETQTLLRVLSGLHGGSRCKFRLTHSRHVPRSAQLHRGMVTSVQRRRTLRNEGTVCVSRSHCLPTAQQHPDKRR